MYELTGRKVLVTGGSRGIGAMLVARFAAEKCDVAINYLNAEEKAKEVAQQAEKAHGVKTVILQGDMANMSDCDRVVQESIQALGGLDIIISNAGNTKITAFDDLDALSEWDWDHAWNVLVKSNVYLLKAARDTFNSNPDGGQLILTSSVGGLSPHGSSMAQSVTRAAGLHLMQCLATTQGPKIRVNAICPGMTLTERTRQMSAEKLEFYKNMSVLKEFTPMDEVIESYVFVAKSKGITGERIRVDSGLIMR